MKIKNPISSHQAMLQFMVSEQKNPCKLIRKKGNICEEKNIDEQINTDK